MDWQKFTRLTCKMVVWMGRAYPLAGWVFVGEDGCQWEVSHMDSMEYLATGTAPTVEEAKQAVETWITDHARNS